MRCARVAAARFERVFQVFPRPNAAEPPHALIYTIRYTFDWPICDPHRVVMAVANHSRLGGSARTSGLAQLVGVHLTDRCARSVPMPVDHASIRCHGSGGTQRSRPRAIARMARQRRLRRISSGHPTAVVCVRCGDPDCLGCEERPLARASSPSSPGATSPRCSRDCGPPHARARATRKFFGEAPPDGPLTPALRFATCEAARVWRRVPRVPRGGRGRRARLAEARRARPAARSM